MSHKIAVHESEHSPAVFIANYKAGVMLKKQIQALNKTERTVCNRIKVDQKVLNNRFQKQVFITKLRNARIKQDKDLEREIFEKHNRHLNTNIGVEEDESLQRIWNQTDEKLALYRLKNDKSVSLLEALTGKRIGSADKRPEISKRPSTAHPGVQRPKSTVSIAKGSKSVRPVTSSLIGKTTNNALKSRGVKFGERNDVDAEDDQNEDDNLSEMSDSEDEKETDTKLERKCSGKFLHTLTEELGSTPMRRMSRPHTSVAAMRGQKKQSMSGPNLDLADPRVVRRLASAAMAAQKAVQLNRESPYIGEDGWVPSLLDIQKLQVKFANYDKKVKAFGHTVTPLKADRSHTSDYYALRLMDQSKACKKNTSVVNVPKTPETEYIRQTRHIGVKNMTIQNINVTDKPSTFVYATQI